MTIDESKTELQSIRALSSRIAERKRRLMSLRINIQNVRISHYGESVGSTDKDKVEKCFDKLRKIEEKLLLDIPKLEALKAEIIAKIEVLPYPQCEVLARHFVDGMKVAVIAQQMRYCRRAVYRILDSGIAKYAKISHKNAQTTC